MLTQTVKKLWKEQVLLSTYVYKELIWEESLFD